MTAAPAGDLAGRVALVAGRTPARWRRVESGYTPAERWVVHFSDGTSAFVKAATSADTARWLRAERRVYASVRAPFLPAVVGWDGDPFPFLVLEDLSGAHWPPPWSRAQIDSLLATLDAVHRTPPPAGLSSLEALRDDLSGWKRVAEDPQPFLAMGLASPAWLELSLPTLLAAERDVRLAGDDFVHFDVRSDNACFVADRAILVDWNWACLGNGAFDVAGWLPSLCAEGGPLPEAILPGEPEVAACLAGFWSSKAGLPPPNPGSRVRVIQRTQLEVALPWAARVLGLPAPS